MRDVWRVLHPDSSLGAASHPLEKARNRTVPTAQFNVRENGATSDSAYNTWRFSKADQKRLAKGDLVPVRPDEEDAKGKRLDYIFAGVGDVDAGKGWVVKSAAVVMTDRHPDLHVSLSDHFGVQATLALHPVPSQTPPSTPPPNPSPSHVHADYDAQLRDLPKQPDSGATELYDEILPMIRRYKAREVKQRYWRGVHFYISVAVWIACLVAVWFSPHNFVSFLLMLLSSLSLVAGVIDGLLALLLFSWEIRALKEFEWEVLNAKMLACGSPGMSQKETIHDLE